MHRSGRRLCCRAQTKNRKGGGRGGGGESANTIAFKCIIHWGRIEREIEIPIWCEHIFCVWEKETASVNMWGCLCNKQQSRLIPLSESNPDWTSSCSKLIYWTADFWNHMNTLLLAERYHQWCSKHEIPLWDCELVWDQAGSGPWFGAGIDWGELRHSLSDSQGSWFPIGEMLGILLGWKASSSSKQKSKTKKKKSKKERSPHAHSLYQALSHDALLFH